MLNGYINKDPSSIPDVSRELPVGDGVTTGGKTESHKADSVQSAVNMN